MKTQAIALYATPEEYADFLFIKRELNRKTDADTIRTMISIFKKNFTKNCHCSDTENHKIESYPQITS